MAAWVAVDHDGEEWMYDKRPKRGIRRWVTQDAVTFFIQMPPGSIERLIGRNLTWDDDPAELTAKAAEPSARNKIIEAVIEAETDDTVVGTYKKHENMALFFPTQGSPFVAQLFEIPIVSREIGSGEG